MSDDLNAGTCRSASTSTLSCCSSRWLTEEVFKLIDIVQNDEAIYNPRHKYYFCRPYVENFWREVDLKLEKNAGSSLAKWTNLRISFRREYTNYLDEKVPPCWSYFDRMFFLHPYLRKKHQPQKSLDNQVQDALAHLNNLSNRMQRERAGVISVTQNAHQENSLYTSFHSAEQAIDNYLEYIDEDDHNNFELDEIIDENRDHRFKIRLGSRDIKAECEELDDYDHDQDRHIQRNEGETLTASAPTPSIVSTEMRFSQQQHYQHLNRLQMRTYLEGCNKRPRSENVQICGDTSNGSATLQTTERHSNISFVRPTFTKPVDLVSTTTTNNSVSGSLQPELDLPTTVLIAPAPNNYGSQRSLMQHKQRIESINNFSTDATIAPAATVSTSLTPHVELCDCKTDPDAMFLMSLLPDIQKLNGRDRGKIKIAFQNILQDYLYPD